MGEGGLVYSDTLGLVIARVTKRVGLDAASRKNPSMLRLLAVWLRDNQPVDFTRLFPFTSISVNYQTVHVRKSSPPRPTTTAYLHHPCTTSQRVRSSQTP